MPPVDGTGGARAGAAGPGAVLGLDAAWTPGNPGGAALAAFFGGRWTCLAVAPDCGLFRDLAAGRLPEGGQWTARRRGGPVDAAALLAACRTLLARAGVGATVSVVAVDMPLSRVPLLARREADNAAARALARYRCGVHSPVPGRPGLLGADFTNSFIDQGFPLAVGDCRPVPALLEVYPHAVFLALQLEHGGVAREQARRFAYKVGRSRQYWPEASKAVRIARLLAQFETARRWLGRELLLPPLPLPPAGATTLAGLKPLEDGLDALACCVMGIRYLAGRARGLGDATGAIWVPEEL